MCTLPIGHFEIGDFVSLFDSQPFSFVIEDKFNAMFSSGVTPAVHNQPYGVAFLNSSHSAISPTLSASLESP